MPLNLTTCRQLNSQSFSLFSLDYRQDQFLFCHEVQAAYLYFRDERMNLLTQEKENLGIDYFLQSLEKIKLEQYFSDPVVLHLFYEMGQSFVAGNIADPELPLGFEIHYKKAELIKGSDFLDVKAKLKVRAREQNSWPSYQEKFDSCYRELLQGNAYQLNLTCPFLFSFAEKTSVTQWLSALWKNRQRRGGHAHATFLPMINRFILSNTPEGLFEVVPTSLHYLLKTRPIKGSIPLTKNNREKVWRKLSSSRKDQGELFMIADLLRNDLNKIERPLAKIVNKKLPLTVPGILHQYSLLEVELSGKTNLKKILQALFPGGSITGAPKKRVMEILAHVEKRARGIYTGSTVLLWKKRKMASINIRTLDIDFESGSVSYGAGGGVTLLSEGKKEHEEMILKVDSVLSLLNSL